MKSGLVHLLCSQIKRILKHLPVDQGQERSQMRVGFITYNSSVHFYNIKSSLAQPQMMVVGDVQVSHYTGITLVEQISKSIFELSKT